MTTYNVATQTRVAGSRDVTFTSRDGSAVTLDTACGACPITIVLNETVLRASNPAANASSIMNEMMETYWAALNNQTRL